MHLGEAAFPPHTPAVLDFESAFLPQLHNKHNRKQQNATKRMVTDFIRIRDFHNKQTRKTMKGQLKESLGILKTIYCSRRRMDVSKHWRFMRKLACRRKPAKKKIETGDKTRIFTKNLQTSTNMAKKQEKWQTGRKRQIKDETTSKLEKEQQSKEQVEAKQMKGQQNKNKSILQEAKDKSSIRDQPQER